MIVILLAIIQDMPHPAVALRYLDLEPSAVEANNARWANSMTCFLPRPHVAFSSCIPFL